MARYRERTTGETLRAFKVPNKFDVETRHGVVAGAAGDYIITDCRGDNWVYDSERFESRYKQIADSQGH